MRKGQVKKQCKNVLGTGCKTNVLVSIKFNLNQLEKCHW